MKRPEKAMAVPGDEVHQALSPVAFLTTESRQAKTESFPQLSIELDVVAGDEFKAGAWEMAKRLFGELVDDESR